MLRSEFIKKSCITLMFILLRKLINEHLFFINCVYYCVLYLMLKCELVFSSIYIYIDKLIVNLFIKL